MILSLSEFVDLQVGMLRQFEQNYYEKEDKQRLYMWLEDYNSWVRINLKLEKNKAENEWMANTTKQVEWHKE